MTPPLLELDFGKVYLLENIMIAELHEGILLDVERNRELLDLAGNHFKEQPYGYISNRSNSYAVNPLVYLESASTETLKAIAVVTSDPVVIQNTIIEKQFYKDSNSFEVFSTLEEAINWIKFIIPTNQTAAPRQFGNS
ncbi:hypothetical protein L1I30_08480 [Gillisia sp. M10.2A]|uniref:STAS/SEC14 domain-containing protein n=1 Tax=Gillisia lutea TaxID=2909668 RepID=A0ABS9EFX7_9FLAO|nr:hypothetical protein [Gillisia lutea]MCF4101698.1 hypothetical protein [Gillisia lutea]